MNLGVHHHHLLVCGVLLGYCATHYRVTPFKLFFYM